MDNATLKLRHTNGDVETISNNSAPPRPRQKNLQVEHIDTDIETDSNVSEPYKTPVALQKKKRTMLAPVIEGEDSQVEQKKQKVIEKKGKKGQRPADNATQVSTRSLIFLITNSEINGRPNIETINRFNPAACKVSC